MKRTLAIAGLVLFTFAQVKAQTNTNSAAATVDYLTLHLQIALTAITNADNGGDVAETGNARINSKNIIQFLSDKLAFPLQSFTNGDGFVAPQRGPGGHPTYSSKAQLLIMQALGTNHGDTFVVIRDDGTNFIVSDYFTFTKVGFENLTNQVVRGNANLDNPNYTAIYTLELKFDNQANSDGGDRVAFDVAGRTKEQRGPVKFKGNVIDPDSVKSLQATVSGTGSLTGDFAVLDGSVNASGAVKESK